MSVWDGIEEYVAVVETGSFTAAAEHLHVSKSFVSKKVSDLEARLGVQLIKRTTRHLSVTAIGERFYASCREMRQILLDATHQAAQMQERPVGKLRISLNDSFGVNFISTVIADFARRYQEVMIEIVSGSREVDLIGEGFDLAIRYGDLTDSSLRAARVGYHSFCLCASPGYLRERGTPRSIADLRDHGCLSDLNGAWWFNSPEGAEKVRVEGRWRSNKGAALRAAARRGLGLAQLPIVFIRDELASGALVAIEEEWAYYDREVWAIFAPGAPVPTNLRFLLDYLSSRFERQKLRPWMRTTIADLGRFLTADGEAAAAAGQADGGGRGRIVRESEQ